MMQGKVNNAIEEDEEWAAPPLFPEAMRSQLFYSTLTAHAFDDPFLQALLVSTPVQRLREIGFLGALDYVLRGNGTSPHRRRHNRFDHSMGVARLAERFANVRELNAHDRRIFIASGLLHDVGHGPLSHTLEPVFKAEFGITHHLIGRNIVLGRTALGQEIGAAALTYGVDLDEILAMIEGDHSAPHAFLFASPINLDTIEGITRTSLFLSRNRTTLGAGDLVDRIAHSNDLPMRELDAFWTLKHNVYNLFIHAPPGLIFDGLAQAYMTGEIDRFAPRDFLMTEPQLRYREPVLFSIFSWARIARNRVRLRVARLGDKLLDFRVMAPVRDFKIRKDIPLRHPTDLWLRYAENKHKRRKSVRQILALVGNLAP
jgi:uncharacterized protein